MTHHRKQQLSPELALASDVFDTFCRATTLKTILGNYRYLCELLDVKPTNFPHFYPKLKSKLCSWRAQALWNKFDKRANHKCYNRGKACSNTRVLIIGAGPCGLRTAIEAQLLGAKVVVIEKRDRMTRNNVLHLWPFVIHDLRALGAKKFFGKFCAGSIDHISIRQLQCILLKVALLLGVEIHEKVSFDNVLPPSTDSAEEKSGWRAQVHPLDHPVSQYEFDVLIGADGKRNTLEGFKRKEFRGKLAIAITANFINHHSEAEARVEEISGVAYIFNQKFFKDLYSETGIDLENIVYYKDETHYFVMTAKKHSLLNKGVILNDYADTAKLLALDNVNRDALLEYAKEAANFSTSYKLPELQFAVNHCGQPDVAMFDFTSMYAAENASRIVQIAGHKLLMCLVGDSLLEPFWPTGSGCARGFLSSMDSCWSLRSWNNGCANPLEVLAERESIYRLLAQTTPENLSRDTLNYTLDPRTRYPNLNLHAVSPIQVTNLFSTDDPQLIEHYLSSPFLTTDYHKKRRKKDFQIHQSTLLTWLKRQVTLYNNVHIDDTNKSFKNGLALCAIIHHYRPDLIDFNSLSPENASVNNQTAFDILEKEYGICPIATGAEMENGDIPNSTMLSYLIQVYNAFKGDIPHIRYLQMDNGLYKSVSDTNIESITNSNKNYDTPKLVPTQKLSRLSKITSSTLRKRYHRNDNRSSVLSNRSSADSSRRSRKRKSTQFHNDEQENNTSTSKQNYYIQNRSNSNVVKPLYVPERLKVSLEGLKHRSGDKLVSNRCRRDLSSTKERLLRGICMLQRQSTIGQESTNADDKDKLFEDYSVFWYRQTAPEFKERVKDLERKLLYPDKDVKGMQEIKRIPMEGDFSNRVKDIENKLKGNVIIDKKPNDLYRSIGKIEKTDWNVKEIEKKIEENKFGRGVQSKVEKVPKWSREQFDDKYLAVKQKLTVNENKDQAASSKYANIDQNLKLLDWKLRNGTVLEQGQRGANKVSAMAAQLAVSNQASEDKPVSQKSAAVSNQITFGIVNSNEVCHFCSKRVYLMERLTAEGKFFHRGCFRCEYCSTLLRLGNYCFDRDGIYGSRFYCVQHFKLPSTSKMKLQNRNQLPSKGNDVIASLSVDDKADNEIIALSKMDTTDTPERIEFENLDIDDEESGNVTRNEMDEDEWTDHNFGTSANELASSNEMSDFSDDSDDEYRIFAPALNHPPGDSKTSVSNFADPYEVDDFVQPITDSVKKSDKSYYRSTNANSNSSNSAESNEELTSNEFDSEDDNSDTATECEADIKARELRMQEVRLEVPKRISHSDTGSDTEVLSEIEQNFSDTCSDDAEEEEYTFSISSDEESATEISTDSEFERNNMTVIRSEAIPDIIITESAPVRRSYLEEAKKVLIIEKDNNNVDVMLPKAANQEPERKITASDVFFNESMEPINPVQCPTALINPRKGDYYLNRTQSTEGIASKMSLELKKKYLLGEVKDGDNAVKKSESTTRLDTEFKSFIEKISKHQKLLNPAPEPSLAMQAFLEGANKLRTTAGNSLTSLLNIKPVKELDGVNEFQHICKRISGDTLNGNADEHDYNHHRHQAQQLQQSEIDDKEETLKFAKMLEVVNLSSTANDSAYNTVDEGPQSSSFSSANMATEGVVEKVLESLTNNGELLTSNEYNRNDNFIIKTARNDAIRDTAGTVEDNLFKSYSDSSSDMCNKIIAVPLLERNSNDSGNNTSNNVQQQQYDKAQILKHVSTPSGLFQSNNNSNNSSNNNNNSNNINSNSGSSSNVNGGNHDSNVAVLVADAAVSDNLTGSDINLSGSDDKSCSYSSPTSIQGDESTLAVFTETELSDWARDEDGTASENCFDDFDTKNITYRRHQKSSATPEFNKRATLSSKLAGSAANFDRYVHVCGREDGAGKEDKWSAATTPTTTLVSKAGIVARSLTLADMDNIEFMDTADGDEDYTSSPSEDDANEAINKMLIENSGYIEYVASDGDEAKTPLAENSRSGFCVLHRRGFGSRLNSVDLHTSETTATVRQPLSTERSSNTVVVSGLDTEDYVIDNRDNCSTAITTGIADKTAGTHSISSTASQPSAAEDCLNSVYDNSAEYNSFIHRLQGRISPFSNVKDSIDIRKARKQQSNNFKLEPAIEFIYPNVAVSNSSNLDAVNGIYRSNCRNTDRFDNMPLIDDSDDTPIPLLHETSNKNIDSDELSTELSREIDSPVFIDEVKNFAETDSSATTNCTVLSPSGDDKKSNDTDSVKCSAESSLSLPDIRRAIHEVEEHLIESTSKEDIIKSVEQLRQNARIRARLMSDSELKISPDEKFLFLKERILSRKGVRSAYQSMPESYSTSYTSPKYSADDLKLVPSSHVHEHPASPTGKSERKKGIIQAVSNFFNKKISVSPTSLDSTSNQSTSKLMRFIPLRGKEKSKEKQHSTSPGTAAVNVPSSSTQEMKDADSILISVSAKSADNTVILNNGILDEDTNRSANSTLKQNKYVKKERQEHLKRLRMAQEIQRQLEELEVKQKELELRGVSVEKALCGENMENVKEESQLKNELLLLMEQRNELQRFECYLLARAQEIEQEDTNARQQK